MSHFRESPPQRSATHFRLRHWFARVKQQVRRHIEALAARFACVPLLAAIRVTRPALSTRGLARASCAAVAMWAAVRSAAGPRGVPQGHLSGKERAQRRRDEDAPERSEEGPSRMSAVPTPGAQRGVRTTYPVWPLLEHRTHQRSIDAWIHALTCENRSYTGDPYTGPSHPYTRIQVNFVAPVLQA